MKKKKIRKTLLNNWGLKAFSLVAAFFLWLVVVISDNPEADKPFYNIPVKLVNTEALTDKDMVYEILDKTDMLRSVTVTAPKSVRDELSADDIVAEADFSKLTAVGTVEINFYSLRYNDRIAYIKGSHDLLKLNIEDKKTRRFSLYVETYGETENGYFVNNVTPDQNRIEISGPESVVTQIAKAVVKVDVTDSSSDISTYSNVLLYDSKGNQLESDRLTMNVKSVRVKVEILDTKTVPVIFNVKGEPADGYLYTGIITSEPELITIAGTTAVLDNIKEIVVPEDVLDITGRTMSLTTNINVMQYLPEGTILKDKALQSKITVTANIEPVVVRSLGISPLNIRLSNVPAGFTAEFVGVRDGEIVQQPNSYSLSIKGLQADIDQVDVVSVFGSIDIKKNMEEGSHNTLIEGVYEMPIEFVLPENIAIAQPLKAYVRITKMEE